jgi:hypothetical protein
MKYFHTILLPQPSIIFIYWLLNKYGIVMKGPNRLLGVTPGPLSDYSICVYFQNILKIIFKKSSINVFNYYVKVCVKNLSKICIFSKNLKWLKHLFFIVKPDNNILIVIIWKVKTSKIYYGFIVKMIILYKV